MDRLRTGIIIPALNEKLTITSVIESLKPFAVPIVVDDGSMDGTGAAATAAGAVVIRHENTQGYDAALNTGFSHAETLGLDFLMTMDADGQHDPQYIAYFLDALQSGADIVIGIRNSKQRLSEHVFAWFTRFRWRIRDPLCGMKAYKTSLYKELGYFDSYGSIGTELMIYAARRQKKLVQIAITTIPRRDKPRFGRRWNANKRILYAFGKAVFSKRKDSVHRTMGQV